MKAASRRKRGTKAGATQMVRPYEVTANPEGNRAERRMARRLKINQEGGDGGHPRLP